MNNKDDFTVVTYKQQKKHKQQIKKNTNLREHKTTEKFKKRILCHNMVVSGCCPYGKNCVYAHSLDEQIVDEQRKYIYDMIREQKSWKDVDLKLNISLLNELIQLTRTCYGCENNVCMGGYNCKNGAISTKMTICYNDLMQGFCGNPVCQKVHLSSFGLIPFKQEIPQIDNKNNILQTNIINDTKKLEISLNDTPDFIDDDKLSIMSDDPIEVKKEYILTLE